MLQLEVTIFYLNFCNIFLVLKSYGVMTDAELVGRVLDGNEHACRFLVSSYQKLVNHIVRRMVLQDAVAEDLCQDVFLRVFRKLHSFRGEARLSTWIASIAYNTAASYLKRKKVMNEQDLDNAGLAALKETENPAADEWDREEIKKLLLDTIETLPLHYRTILTLYYLDEFSYREIGEITGLPEGTIKSYLHRSRHLLKSKLEKILDHEGRTVLSP